MDVECDDEMELTKLERDIARTSDDNMPWTEYDQICPTKLK